MTTTTAIENILATTSIEGDRDELRACLEAAYTAGKNATSEAQASREAIAERLIADLDDTDTSNLDETVHDYASRIGSQVTNNGVFSQIIFLLEQGESEDFIREALG
jgi:ribosome-binding protein aMBF1 (putative translation factor)